MPGATLGSTATNFADRVDAVIATRTEKTRYLITTALFTGCLKINLIPSLQPKVAQAFGGRWQGAFRRLLRPHGRFPLRSSLQDRPICSEYSRSCRWPTRHCRCV